MGAAARAVTGNAEIKWALQDSFELQGTVQLGPLALIIGGGTLILTSEHLLDRVPKHWVVDEDEVPGLHEANRGGCVGGREQPGEHLPGDWVGLELRPHVPPFVDCAVQPALLFRAEFDASSLRHCCCPILRPNGSQAQRRPKAVRWSAWLGGGREKWVWSRVCAS